MIRTCLQCGADFNTEDRRSKYCSRSCYQDATGNPDAHDRACEACGTTFSSYDMKSKYCSAACYNKSRSVSERSCPTCGKTFVGRRNQVYCSVKCINLHLPISTCGYCGQVFRPRTARKKKFCSLDCYHASLATEYPRSRMNFSEKEKRIILERDGGRCVKCGSTENLEFDHILAVCNGGQRTIENGQTLCVSCHDEKTRQDKAFARGRLCRA